jgi:alkylation response protein AidB-like acyl-CoA dehydrogenase
MDYQLSESQELLRESVRKVMQRIATPEYLRQLDEDQAYPERLYDAFIEMGLYRMPFPEEYGGLGGNVFDIVITCEEIGRYSYDLFATYSGTAFLGLGICKNGSEDQKKYWLPRIFSGQAKMSLSMSEPDAGSDIGAMRTSAVREGDEWIINGHKIWSTGAGATNNVINLYARTDPSAVARNAFSLFLVEGDRPGVTLKKINMLGRRCIGTYEIFFDNVRVPNSHLVGDVNKGWRCMMSSLELERVAGTAAYCGNAQGIVDLALQYAKDRKQFGRSIGSNQSIAHMLADMQTKTAAAKALNWRAAQLVSENRPAMREVSMAKLFASENLVETAGLGMQIFGANGYSMDYDMQRYYRDARSATIAGGTSQILRSTIARSMGLADR